MSRVEDLVAALLEATPSRRTRPDPDERSPLAKRCSSAAARSLAELAQVTPAASHQRRGRSSTASSAVATPGPTRWKRPSVPSAPA